MRSLDTRHRFATRGARWLRAVVLLLGGAFSAPAALAQGGTTIAIEADPAPFVLGGFGGHLKVSPAALDHWVFGIGGASGLDLPKFLVEMNPDNRGEGWAVRLRHGYGVFADYYFDPSNRGWLLGVQAGEQSFEITRAEVRGRARITDLVVMTHAGYRWFPAGGGIYLQPWAGLGYATRIRGSNRLGAESYEISRLVPFATVHVGYRF